MDIPTSFLCPISTHPDQAGPHPDPENIPETVTKLLEECLNDDPSVRPTFDDVYVRLHRDILQVTTTVTRVREIVQRVKKDVVEVDIR